MKKSKKTPRRQQHVRRATRRLHLLAVPHRANHYRPHLVRRFGLVAVVIVAFALPVVFGHQLPGSSSEAVLGDQSRVTPEAVFAATNKARQERGVKTLQPNDKLSAAAAQKAHDMLQRGYWAHTSPSGVTPWYWFEKTGYHYSTAGENLAKNFGTTDALMNAWFASSEHRANLLNDQYRDIGVAVVRGSLHGEPTQLVVALYAAPEAAVGALAAHTTTPTLAARPSVSPLERLMISWQTLSPAAIFSVAMLALVSISALLAHVYRAKLPKSLRQSWYRHHGLAKTFGLASIAVVIVSLYGTGQI